MSWEDDSNELVVDGPTTFPLDRRDFLKLTSTGLLVLVAVDPASALQGRQGRPVGGAPPDINAYLHIGADNKVTCLAGKVEYGQGVITSLRQLLAEELDVPLTSTAIILGDTDLCPYDMGTFGSLSIRTLGPVMRNAAAQARAVLLQMAADKLQVPVESLAVKDGVVTAAGSPAKTITYGQLTEGNRIERTITAKAQVKPVKAYTIVGTSAPRIDAADKVSGKAKYAGDIVPPGALHARILRPPAHGATMTSVDTSAAEKVPGVKVIRDGDMVAVLHERWDVADKALGLVKAQFTRNDPPVDNKTIFDHLVKNAPAGQSAGGGGDVATAAARVFEQTYYDSYMAHAPMETHSAVAAVEDGKVTVWVGTQTPFPVKNQLMSALRLPAEKVRVITPFVGGGFGGKSASRQAVEAARLAMLAGKPVRVIFSRAEEFFYDTFRPAAVIRIKSGLDASNVITHWDYQVYAAGNRGAAHFYNIANHRTMVYGSWGGGGGAAPSTYHPFAIGPWRAPGASTNAFGRESHIDVMAAKAGVDPVAFRLKNLTDPRMIRVLNAAAKKFGWTPKAAPSGRGVGVALGIDADTYDAICVEVAVDKPTGRVRVKRVVCAQDMGVIVNPEGAIQQVEGCITMGLGYTFSEEIRFKGGEIFDKNFDTYELPRFSDVPVIETVLVDAPDIPSAGGGEPAIVPLGAAVANAIFDAVGARLLQLPMTPARVKEAIARG